jgi:hypothetical protein
VYSSTQFGGPVTISGLEVFNTQYSSTAAPDTGTFTISLSTTSLGPSTLSGNFSTNEGADMTQVFSGSIAQSWAFGDTLTITFSTPFSYNPGSGNLLLDVVGSGTLGTGLYFDVNSSDSNVLGRVYCTGGDACGNAGSTQANYGLVTGFITGAAGTPEPGTIGLAALGLISTLALRRRRA